jgi:ABC-type Mn2+/Zn2+ transport system ATPase subunit
MIECKNLVVGYTTPLTKAFSLNIPDNKWFGIIGENGIGKSTFMKTILGDIKPISGCISVFGQNAGNTNNIISYIPQEREINLSDLMSGFTLIKSSYAGARYGVSLFNRKLHLRALELLELVGATKYQHQPFNTLSGGQKKRIFLAQALINDPKLLLLDEPLADLDPSAKQHFIEALQEIHNHQSLGLLIISHDMHEIAAHLDGFIHFKDKMVHSCIELPCAAKDTYVGI